MTTTSSRRARARRWVAFGVLPVVCFAFSAAAGVAGAGPTSYYASANCNLPSQYAYGDVISGPTNWWDTRTSECSWPNPNEAVLHGAAAVLWGPSGICRSHDYVYATDLTSNTNSVVGAPCGHGNYATGGGHRTFNNWSWKEWSAITGVVPW